MSDYIIFYQELQELSQFFVRAKNMSAHEFIMLHLFAKAEMIVPVSSACNLKRALNSQVIYVNLLMSN